MVRIIADRENFSGAMLTRPGLLGRVSMPIPWVATYGHVVAPISNRCVSQIPNLRHLLFIHFAPSESRYPDTGCELCYDIAVFEMDAQLIDHRFEATEPRRNGVMGWYGLMGLAIGAFLVPTFQGDGSGIPQWILFTLPWGVVLSMLIVRWIAVRREFQHRRAISEAWDHARLLDWSKVEQSLEGLMDRPIRSASDRCQVFVLMADLAEQSGLYESATHIYEKLLLDRIGDGYQLQQAQLALTSAKLRNEELTDGVRMLDRLEKVPMPLALRAVHDLIRLYQQVFMGHFDNAVKDLQERHELFRRYLSTRAGYGYALFSAALHQLDRPDEASRLWLDATALIPAARLVSEYNCLEAVSKAYPATEHRL